MSNYSGEELYKGIFFGRGTYAANLTKFESNQHVARYSEDDLRLLDSQIESVIGSLKQKDPAFFPSFKSRLMSADHIQVEEILRDGTKKMLEHCKQAVPQMEKIENQLKEDIKAGKITADMSVQEIAEKIKSSPEYDGLLDENILSTSTRGEAGLVWAAAAAVYFVVAVHNHIVGAGGIYLYFSYWGPSIDSAAPPEDGKEGKKLENEMLIEDIVKTK